MLQNSSDHQFGLSSSVVEKIIKVLREYPEIDQAILYGSRAKGNYRVGSDIDLALIGKAFTERQLLELEVQLDELLLPYKIDLNRMEVIENQDLVEHIKRVGKLFYQ